MVIKLRKEVVSGCIISVRARHIRNPRHNPSPEPVKATEGQTDGDEQVKKEGMSIFRRRPWNERSLGPRLLQAKFCLKDLAGRSVFFYGGYKIHIEGPFFPGAGKGDFNFFPRNAPARAGTLAGCLVAGAERVDRGGDSRSSAPLTIAENL